MSSRFRGGLRMLPLLVAVTPVMAAAQVEPPVRDTLQVVTPDVQDTVPRRTLHAFPSMPVAASAGYAGGEWIWDREALLREAPVSLLDLLERIPGITPLRGGVFAQPEAAAAFGMTAGRIEIEVDGFVLDPLAASTLDLSQIPLGQLREVRVQRRLGLLRVRLLTDRPFTDQPYTRIEAGIGEPSGNLFRGVLLAPYVIVGPLGAAIERLDTDGTDRREPADIFSGWIKWAWTGAARGVQVEWQRTTLEREPESPWPAERARQDVVLRARNAFSPDFVAELFAGRSSSDEAVPGTATDSTDALSIDRSTLQAGARVGYQASWAALGAVLRYRDAEFLPSTEVSIDAVAGYGPVRGGAEFGRAAWREADATAYTGLFAEVGPVVGATAFAEITRGSRAAPRYRSPFTGVVPEPDPEEPGTPPQPDSEPLPPLITQRDGWRAGVRLDLGRASGRLALIRVEQDRSTPFGLPFDSAGVSLVPTTLSGIEASGRFIIVRDMLALESWITDWQDPVGWLYLPVRSWRTALELHTVPLPSGNLEVLARLEGGQRGAMLVFEPDPAAESPLRSLPAATTFSGYLQIRVIDVRAFLRWEDLLGANPEGLPERMLRGPRIFYGVKWNLWN
jgi:hypothetical protein